MQNCKIASGLSGSETYKTIGVVLLTVLLIAVTFGNASWALEPPAGEVLLKIDGDIQSTNNGDEAWFDLAMLKELGSAEIKTETPWTDGLAKFTGVRLKELMEKVGASGKPFIVEALDKYTYDFTGDYDKYPVILAWQLNDEPLTVRTLGPLWIMLPFSDFAEINTAEHKNAAVWQVQRLTVY